MWGMVLSRMTESREQLHALARAADDARRDSRWEDAAVTAQAMLDHPCAQHMLVDYEVLDELHQALRQAGRYDEAIEAKRAAIAAGYTAGRQHSPHGLRCSQAHNPSATAVFTAVLIVLVPACASTSL